MSPVSKQNLLEYIAHLSKELAILAQAKKLDFSAYILNMIHMESSREIGLSSFQKKAQKAKKITSHPMPDILVFLFSITEVMNHVCWSNGLKFIGYLFGILHSHARSVIVQNPKLA